MTQYLIFAGRKEPYLVERELPEMDSQTTLRDIASGEWENVSKIIALREDGIWADVTDIFARKVMELWANGGEPLTRWQRDFVEQHVSVQAANSFRHAEAV
jgi:hypothetical protein